MENHSLSNEGLEKKTIVKKYLKHLRLAKMEMLNIANYANLWRNNFFPGPLQSRGGELSV